ncbi:hypothetical protein HNQ07_001283 [Deinococcus metalli]|uniref:UPF0167 protein n=1 Tax=Deinococcus metalli TaxID=1141878 RepID=A0A7W8KF13_9DEIO|nr:CbrC family protein [Deinococcus metalli]MBB5375826.1 hypothetical protein [Deinococcus metalli]GHF36747.1 UPF0167 protein [Deinococcus metalli]
MTDPLPDFRYYADPYGDRTIIEEDITCRVCGAQRAWKYDGVLYAADELDAICPWCVANGHAAEKFDGCFQDVMFPEAASEESVLWVLMRTPSVASWNPFEWPEHCGECCRYIGDLRNHRHPGYIESASVQTDLFEISRKTGLTRDEVLSWADTGSIYLRLFQCVQCGTYRVILDLD